MTQNEQIRIFVVACIFLTTGGIIGEFIGSNKAARMKPQRIAHGEGSPIYKIVIDTKKQAYVYSRPVATKPFQKLLGVEQDGKIGPETIGKTIEYNLLDEIK